MVVDGHVLVTNQEAYGLLVLSYDGDSIEESGFYQVDGEVSSATIVDGTAYLVQGMYGMTMLDLP
jgi:hypothetical protein